MIYRNGQEVSLPPKAVETLIALIERPGEIIGKDELMEVLWPDSVVEESNLAQYLHALRKVLGTTSDDRPLIETLRRRGYRFNGVVSILDSFPSVSTIGPSRLVVGREDEIAQVCELLRREDVRLLTLTGVGGVGKTTLAKVVAHLLRDDFEGGVVFVELAGITNAELVPSSIAAALGIKESGERPIVDVLNESLQNRRVLLVLDNFEQLISAASSIVELLGSAPDLKVLTTSRAILHISMENEYLVPPLQLPPRSPINVSDANSLDELAGFEAIRLFIDRARHSKPNFELKHENANVVAEICSRLDGLPLAIELAAARIRLLSPAAILARLQSQLSLLTGGSSDMPERQQTMRSTMAWSYGLLSERDQKLFARLAVFSGGFTLEAAEKVCCTESGASALDVLNGLTALVEHSLLAPRDQTSGDPRFQMLEVVREYAAEVLAERGETDRVRRRHAEFFMALGEEAEPYLQAARSAEYLNVLEADHDNLRRALDWAKENDPELGQRLAGAIWRFWWLHGHIREGCEQLGSFLAQSAEADMTVRAKMLSGAAALNRLRGSTDLSRVLTEQALVLARNADDQKNAALSLHQLGFLTLDDQDFAEAGRLFEEGLSLAKELGDKQVLALLYNGLGELARLQEDFERASEFYSEALQFNREVGDRVRQTTSLINLGATALSQGYTDKAGAFYREGLEISSDMADMNGTLYCLEGVAGSFWGAHDPERSAILFGAAAAAREATNLFIEPADLPPYERSVALVRSALPEPAFDVLYAEGQKMKLDEAVAVALSQPKNTD
jgi:predicted ATPase/DNA-binding winged helix-turn-helix (wHTH) protein